ncbi:hypothetical protein C8F04DRAFT_1221047 [Mycena alexandri]|uniref:DUF7587 domain-containing protein n=1 Tax=Mycena alexandri TaxID=1745969 RepID=A0AAD6X1Z4_9AGAR|nr:hypothetical protein C8F04DRAFT_1221047 [Mycena alexandri]
MPLDAGLLEFLPQYGFGTDTEFKKLVERNAFLFRVHTPKPSTSAEVPFPALKFDWRYTSSTGPPSLDPPPATYNDVARHMDWTTRHSSPYISTSFSFMWAVWEAVRRYHFGVKHDVEIAVIDATAVAGGSLTVVEILRAAPSADRHERHWKWFEVAHESQSVLVYGGIPQFAVLASIPILRIVNNLPSYCFRRLPPIEPRTPLDRLASSFLAQKPSFRKFCEMQSAYFLRSDPQARFIDSTSTSVRLALTFLGVWFHWMLQTQPPPENDPNIFCDAAVTKVTELARIIASWPAANETNKMWDTIIHEIALLVAEQVKLHRRISDAEPISAPRPRVTFVPELDTKRDSGEIPVILNPRNYLPTPPPTPPPIRMSHSAPAAERSLKIPPALSPGAAETNVDIEDIVETLHAVHSSRPHSPSPLSNTSSAPAGPATAEGDVAKTLLEVARSTPTPLTRKQSLHIHSMSETASCLLTGFLFGALIIIVLSAQRRPTLLRVG